MASEKYISPKEKRIKDRKEKAKEEGTPEIEDGDEFIFTSLVVDYKNKLIAEQVYNSEGSQFCIYDVKKDSVSYDEYFQVDNVNYKPFPANLHEEVFKEALMLPEKAEEYGNEEELDEQIKKFIWKWLDIPDDVLQFALWNIKRSWVYDRFHTLNYLRALGDTGQGKTRFLDVLGHLHYKPISTSGATTAAPVFRIIEKWHGTLIMDEADFGKSDETQDMIKIINCGYEKGKHIMRCDTNNPNAIGLFDAYGPKILATRKAFRDKATESRCITQVMTGTRRKDICFNLNPSFFEETQEIRNKLLMWRFRNFFNIEPDTKIEFDLGELEPRVQQIVMSFIALFKNKPKQLEEFKIFIQKHQENIVDERRNSFDGEIVGAIHKLLKDGIIEFSAHDIIEAGELTGFDGKPLKPRSMTSRLKSLGFEKSISKKVGGKAKRCVPVTEELLQLLFERYGYEVTVVTVLTEGGVARKGDNLLEFEGLRNNSNDSNLVTNSEQLKTPISSTCNLCGVTKKLTHKVDGNCVCEACFLTETDQIKESNIE